MAARNLSPLSLRSPRPSLALGAFVAVVAIVIETLAIYPLAHAAAVASLGVVYLIGVVVVSTYWGIWLGLLTAFISALAFNFFHLPPVGRLTIADQRNWVSLASFIVVAATTSVIADLARARAEEADRRRREADLATELARTLLGGADLDAVLAVTGQRLAGAIGASSAVIELGVGAGDERHFAFALREGEEVIGALLLPAAFAAENRERILERVVPALQSVLAAAHHRAELQAEVVETAALRRNDELKTALLRSVSHDLRTPLTAILTAGAALDPERSDREELTEVRAVVLEAATRLADLVEKLLDLSRLQAGGVQQHVGAYALEEVLGEAIENVGAGRELVRISVDSAMPLLEGDASQLERAFANLLENAVRYSNGKPVSVRARVVGDRVRVRIVDQGPGIRAGELERIFMPFYRAPAQGDGHQGSGLGLAIAKGFIEVNGGRISVESLPGQGTSFVIEFPLGVAASPQGAGV
ncbi:MAG TPA: ATP-binding protein [Solirubrobacteraceae bacterium]|jgi:two-component system sensor histidine kinase KdpD